MRIALLPSAYHPAVGGVEELTRHLATTLHDRGHQVEVWTSRGPSDPERDRIDGLVVRRYRFPAPRLSAAALARWPLEAGAELLRLWRALREFRPEVLHVQCFSTNGAYATVLSALTGMPLIVTLQGETVMDDQDIYERSAFFRTSLRVGLKVAAQVTACSQFTLDDAVARFGLSRRPLRVVFNGVALEGVAASPVTVPFDRYVFAVGRVVAKKGFDLLLEAWSLVEQQQPGVGLVIGGSGPALEGLRRSIRTLGLSNVHLPGGLGRDEVAWLMEHADAFVMPSRLEPFGIVVLEAWRSGTAVLASCHGGAGEFVVDGETGLLIDPFDIPGLAEALLRVLKDPDLRQSLGAAGARRVPQFGWGEITTAYESIYASAAGPR